MLDKNVLIFPNDIKDYNVYNEQVSESIKERIKEGMKKRGIKKMSTLSRLSGVPYHQIKNFMGDTQKTLNAETYEAIMRVLFDDYNAYGFYEEPAPSSPAFASGFRDSGAQRTSQPLTRDSFAQAEAVCKFYVNSNCPNALHDKMSMGYFVALVAIAMEKKQQPTSNLLKELAQQAGVLPEDGEP